MDLYDLIAGYRDWLKYFTRKDYASHFALYKEAGYPVIANIDDPKQAQDKLLRWIKRDKKFHEKLLSLSITPNDNHYNPQQIRELVLKFGAPGEYEI